VDSLLPFLFLALFWTAIGYSGYLILQTIAEIFSGVNQISLRGIFWLTALIAIFVALLVYEERVSAWASSFR
jgi:hypothetical protein